MTVDRAVSAWEAMLTETNRIADVVDDRGARQPRLIVALRTIAFLVLAALAILVLLPAALLAQAALAA